jgi:putative membrane protein
MLKKILFTSVLSLTVAAVAQTGTTGGSTATQSSTGASVNTGTAGSVDANTTRTGTTERSTASSMNTGTTSMTGTTGTGTGTTATTTTEKTATTTTEKMETGSTAASSTALSTDGEIAKVLMTINEGEIDAAQVAVKKAKKQEVREFAEEMISNHRDNKKETKNMAKATDRDATALSKSVKEDAKTINKQLKKESRDSFDMAYVQAQIDMHQKALDILDANLIPSAKSDSMRTHLQKTREAVAKHLGEAQELKTKIQ